MKLDVNFVLREIAGEYLVVPLNDAAARIHGVLSLTETGAFLWNLLGIEQTEDTLALALLTEYDVDEDSARIDVANFVASLKEYGCLQ